MHAYVKMIWINSCKKNGVKCDYSIRLNWEGRRKKKPEIGGIIDFRTTIPAATSIPAKPEISSGKSVFDGARTSPSVESAIASTSSAISVQQHSLPHMPSSRTSLEQLVISPQPNFMSEILPPMSHQELNSSDDTFQILRPRSFSQPTQTMRSRPSSLNLNTINHNPQFNDSFQQNDLSNNQLNHHSLSTINEIGGLDTISYSGTHPLLSPVFSTTPDGFSEHSGPQFSARPSLLGNINDQDDRRPGLTVNSLLSGPPSREDGSQFPQLVGGGHVLFEHDLDSQEQMSFHGIDRGYKDLDIDKNNDMNAISSGDSPIVNRDPTESYFDPKDSGDLTPTAEFGFGVNANDEKKDNNFYYRQPVPILIPRSFKPLPKKYVQSGSLFSVGKLIIEMHFLCFVQIARKSNEPTCTLTCPG